MKANAANTGLCRLMRSMQQILASAGQCGLTKVKMRAQTSTEYLIILAIAVVIALVVVSTMGGIPTLGGQIGSRAEQAYWQTADIAIVSYKMVAAGDDTLVVKNNQRFRIRLTSMYIGDTNILSSARTIRPGQTGTITAAVASGTAGDSYKYSVNATYYDDELDVGPFTFAGAEKLSGTLQ